MTGSGVIEIHFSGMGFFEAQNVACELDDHHLHSEAKSEIRDILFAAILRGQYFPFPAPLAESARDEISIAAADGFFNRAVLDDPV